MSEIRENAQQLSDLQAKRKTEENAASAAGKSMETLKLHRDELQVSLEKARSEEDSINSQKNAHLGDQSIRWWRQEERNLIDQYTLLKNLKEFRDQMRAFETDKAEFLTKRKSVKKSRTSRQKSLALKEKAFTDAGHSVTQLTEILNLRIRVASLEDDRKRLVSGEVCPLCGSREHPYTDHLPLSEDKTREELRQAEIIRDALNIEIADLKAAIAGLDAEDSHLKDRIDRCGKDVGALDKKIKRTFTALDLSPEDVSEKDGNDLLKTATVERERIRKIIGRFDELDARYRTAESQTAEYRKLFGKAEETYQASVRKSDAASTRAKGIRDEIARLESTLFDRIQSLGTVLSPFGFKHIEPDTLDQVAEDLKNRMEAFNSARNRIVALEKELNHTVTREQAEVTRSAEIEKSLADSRKEQDGIRSKLQDTGFERKELFGEKDPDTEEKCVRDAVKNARTLQETVQKKIGETRETLAGLNQKIVQLDKRHHKWNSELKNLEPSFLKKLLEAGFSDEAALGSARLDEITYATLNARSDALKKAEIDITSRIREITGQSERQRDLCRNLPEMAALENSLESLKRELQEKHGELGAIRERLQNHDEQIKCQGKLLKEIEDHKRELDRWERLNTLVGSASGAKFKNFAQGLTFEIMVYHANEQLIKMSDRYLLVRDETEPLEINVVDNYQAGEIRATQNLSGGESFIVSLALALGLSAMASRNARVDSIFLDEGFGTLDEETLESALNALAGLHREGKLIGVISHVAALKDRIPCQIQVEPLTGGRSRLVAPGVTRERMGE